LSEDADLLLRGGVVIDGSGAPGVRADVAVRGDRITAIGDLGNHPAGTTIEVSGRIVAPGFIDVHTHDDLACIRDPAMLAKLSQGVTTAIVGNCGISAAPVRFAGAASEPFNLLGDGSEFAFRSFGDYAAAIDAARPSINVAALIGHSTLRLQSMGDLTRRADRQEIARMCAILGDCLAEGALGLSSGVFYAPAEAADTDEIAPLAALVAQAGGAYTAHIRDEYDGIADAMEEFFSVSDDVRLPLVLSHHKCAGVPNWGRSRETLALIDATRKRRPVFLDCYPYAAGSTILREDLADGLIEVLVNWSEPHPEMAGRRLRSVAEEWRCTESEAARRLAPGGASYFQMHEDDVRAIMRHEGCMIGSDGLPNDPLPHPRLWGTFPRVLGHYSRDLGLMPLEEAVHRMTGLSAATFHLPDRGRIAEGAVADITVFDPESVADTATYDSPHQISRGIDYVLVGGVLSWAHGQPVGERAGRFIRRAAT